jgi:hypothetical protein
MPHTRTLGIVKGKKKKTGGNNININPTTDCRATAPSQLQHKNFMSSIHHRDAVKLALRHAAISTFLGIR